MELRLGQGIENALKQKNIKGNKKRKYNDKEISWI